MDNVIKTLYSILQQVRFENEALIESQSWEEADRLTKGVDSFDISYVALTLQTGGWLWTGDKKLTTHLRAMGFERVLNTEELFQMIIAR
ncbi:PIN domain-containing protein [Persicitalea sp.]|uniref:PIN domain-containing protein n=1 Tax=Persicitalea sp. TaxID=3100273 RepID=UPI00359374ED